MHRQIYFSCVVVVVGGSSKQEALAPPRSTCQHLLKYKNERPSQLGGPASAARCSGRMVNDELSAFPASDAACLRRGPCLSEAAPPHIQARPLFRLSVGARKQELVCADTRTLDS
ncbi:UNVERIFIED_CONTAM: hypothetical protein K2H54_052732 [Gekko kuhli]